MRRHKHTLSNYRLATFDMGQLIPVGLVEALPGDTFQLSTSAVLRLSPLAAPLQHPVTARVHHFYVPHRTVFPEWEDFITGGPDGDDATALPTLTVPATIKGTLWDHMGLANNGQSFPVLSFAINGINAIWNEYFRDQDLIAERALTDTSIPSIAWEKDYLTSARPWTQKGSEVTLPLAGDAPVKGIGAYSAVPTNLTANSIRESDGTIRSMKSYPSTGSPYLYVEANPDKPGFPNIHADLSQAGSLSVRQFREMFALQRYKEARARYGSRYTEYLRYLGVTPSDARLQRPEYLGGGTARVNFSEVLQTTPTDTPSVDNFGVGDLYGHGIAGLRTRPIRKFIEEHGYVHSFISIRPKAMYMNGVPRHFLRQIKEDYWQKELEHIGQQEIYAGEVYASATGLRDTFGFADRYDEYRRIGSSVAGDYRDVLNFWHMARELPSNVALNEDFVTCVPTKRVHNVQTNDVVWGMINNHCVARRLVTRNATPRVL